MTATDDGARVAAREFAEALAAFWNAELGPQLLGLYLLGSLAHGGFSRRYSDIDIGLVAETALDADAVDRMRARAAALSPDLAPKLSLFWSDRTFAVGRFPPLDRVDYCDHAVPLVERERVRPPRPSLEEIRGYLGGAPLDRWADTARRFAAADTLDAKDHKAYVRVHLYPARFVYSWMTGRMGSNDEAVAFLRGEAPAGLDVDLVARALAIRHAAADPDPLFPARAALPRQVDACTRLAGR